MANSIKKINEIKSEILTHKKNLMNLKFQKSTGQLEKTSQIKSTRVKIARLKTEISKLNLNNGDNNA